MTKKTMSYRQAMEELESIVKKIEQNEPDVDELNDLVTRAVELVKYCKTRLKSTEEKLKENLEELD